MINSPPELLIVTRLKLILRCYMIHLRRPSDIRNCRKRPVPGLESYPELPQTSHLRNASTNPSGSNSDGSRQSNGLSSELSCSLLH